MKGSQHNFSWFLALALCLMAGCRSPTDTQPGIGEGRVGPGNFFSSSPNVLVLSHALRKLKKSKTGKYYKEVELTEIQGTPEPGGTFGVRFSDKSAVLVALGKELRAQALVLVCHTESLKEWLPYVFELLGESELQQDQIRRFFYENPGTAATPRIGKVTIDGITYRLSSADGGPLSRKGSGVHFTVCPYSLLYELAAPFVR